MKKIVLPEEIEGVLSDIFEKTKPISIFVYGSKSRDDAIEESDYEVGALYKKTSKWSRQQLLAFNKYKYLKIYPFVYEDFIECRIDTPFPQAIYIKQLFTSAVTIKGKGVLESIEHPEIRSADLIESVGFCLGRAYSAVVSSRQQDWLATVDGFTKSVFYGFQVLIILRKNKFISSYNDICDAGFGLDLDEEYKKVLEHAWKVRKGEEIISIPMLFTNISFLNQLVLGEIKRISADGDMVLIEGKKISY